MASYQARQRDPLFDSNTQALIERRGKELLGFGLIVLAILVALILWSYSPDDPSWLSATDEPARNLLGRLGASIASPMIVIAGLGSWAVALIPAVWGVRFVAHIGEERALSRMIFAPIAVALASVYASTHVPGAGWGHSFGLGGLFGDTVLGAVLGVIPVKATLGLKVMSVAIAAGMVAMAAFVLGATRVEVARFGRFLLLGIIMIYAMIARALGLGASGTAQGLRALIAGGWQRRQLRRQERARRRALAREDAARDAELAGRDIEDAPAMAARLSQPVVRRSEPVVGAPAPLRADPRMGAPAPGNDLLGETAADPQPGAPDAPAPGVLQQPRPIQKSGLLARLPALLKRTSPPAVEPEAGSELFSGEDMANPEIRARIAQIVRNRVAQRQQQAEAAKTEPPLRASHPRGPRPMILQGAVMNPAAAQEVARAHDLPLDDPAVQTSPAAPVASEGRAFDSAPAGSVAPGGPTAKKVVQHPPRKPVQPSRRARAEAQPALQFEETAPEYDVPPLGLLASPDGVERLQLSDEALEENARMLENVLDDYGVKGEIVSVRPGPVVTMYELEPAPGLKASRVIGLSDDIARSMSALSARVSTVPGRSVIGIELPNEHREKVMLREILSSRDFGDSNMKLPLALGKGIGGEPVVASLAKMPHLLIAGTTGSGKSVAINTMILSLLYKLTPDECRLIMIDPKMLELSVYDGIPHLLSPVVTDPKKAVVALKWVVAEMEERYRKMSKMGVRNIEGYNGRVQEALDRNEMFSRTVQTGFDDETGDPVFETEEIQPEKLPYIVVIVDEMADLMMVAGKEIEACIQRLAQMARASGIHLIMATQRPSVDVITGTIKANFPTRISFQVTSKVDSRTILGEQGAEQLLGMGDMLYMAGGAKITRVHGPFVSDEEVEEIVNHLKAYGPPEYVGGVVEGPDSEKESELDLVLGLGGNTTGEDALYDQAVAIVAQDRKCSTSYIQRKLAIGYNKAARLVEQMEENGLVSPANHVGKREILIPEQQ